MCEKYINKAFNKAFRMYAVVNFVLSILHTRDVATAGHILHHYSIKMNSNLVEYNLAKSAINQ